MTFLCLRLEPRLQRRYVRLVNEHLRAAPPLAAGPAALPRLTAAFASTQAAWRFFANDAASLPALVAPLQAAGHRALEDSPAEYALLVHDWSLLNYHRHAAKADQVLFSRGSDRGYELASALLVDAANGDPLAPLELRLRTAAAVQSTPARPPAFPEPPRRAVAHPPRRRRLGAAASAGPRHRLRGRFGGSPAPLRTRTAGAS